MMRQINNNEYQYIVATDIAARGIDIDGVSHVINMQFPTEPDFIFIEVDVQGVETIQVFVIVCMIQQMKKILQFLKEKELNLRICNLKTDNLWI